MTNKIVPNEIIDKIIESSLQSPSSHNTQPWLISIEENKIYFFVDETRHLAVADPTDRELYVSIGCCIANAIVEAENQGFVADLTLFPKKDNVRFVAEMKLSASDSKKKYAELQPFIRTRLSNRSEYKKEKKISVEFIHKAKKIAQQFDASFHFVNDDEKKSKLAELTRTAINKAISTPEFRNELVHWIRHNWTKKTDGMPGYTSGVPGVASILFPALIHSPSMPKKVSDSEYEMVMNSSGVCIITTRKDEPTHWVNVGVALEMIWLSATKESLSLSLLSGAVEYEVERNEVRKILAVSDHPCVFFRIGYSTKLSRSSPRRTREDVVRPLAQLSHFMT